MDWKWNASVETFRNNRGSEEGFRNVVYRRRHARRSRCFPLSLEGADRNAKRASPLSKLFSQIFIAGSTGWIDTSMPSQI